MALVNSEKSFVPRAIWSNAGIIYRSFILPVLDYCNTVWNCCGRTNTDKKNYRDVRQGLSMQTNSSDEALAHLKYHKLGLRREIHALNLVKKCLNKRCPQFLMDYFYFNRDIVQRKTRQSNHLRLPSIKLECTKKLFIIVDVKFLTVICSFY